MAEVWTPPAFDDIATSETVTAAYLNSLGNSLRFLKRVGHTSFSSDVNATGTTVGTANQIASIGAVTYEAVPHYLWFYCPRVDQAAAVCHVILRDSTTVVGTLADLPSSQNTPALSLFHPITPTAASHTYNVAAWVGSGTWTFNAGSGGVAGDATTYLQGFVAIFRQPT